MSKEIREIKFRGLTLDNVWVYGYLTARGPYYFIENDKGGNDAVIENTIGQFTGLRDKQGKDIYEGDMLSKKYKVEVYRSIEGTWMVRFHTNPKSNKPRSLYDYLRLRLRAGCPDDCEVGISSLIAERQGPLLFAIRALTPRNFWRALTWKHHI